MIKFKRMKELEIKTAVKRIKSAFEATRLILEGTPPKEAAAITDRGDASIIETFHRVCKKLNPDKYQELLIKNAKRRAKKFDYDLNAFLEYGNAATLMKDIVNNKDYFLGAQVSDSRDGALSARAKKTGDCLILDLEFYARAKNALLSEDILFLSDLLLKTESELLSIKFFGRRSLYATMQMLAERGLHLRFEGEVEDPKTIKPGRYKTVKGKTAYVWAWDQRGNGGKWGYKGFIEKIGYGIDFWDSHGRDMAFDNHLVLEDSDDSATHS